MKILGIETSCDETAVAIIDVTEGTSYQSISILSNIVSSQMKLHAKFGGVVPNLAKREHQKNLVSVLVTALKEAGSFSGGKISGGKELSKILEREPALLNRVQKSLFSVKVPEIDAIAVTVGPGLAPALWVGVNFARALSYLWKKPVIPVNHLEGHIYTNVIPEGVNVFRSAVDDRAGIDPKIKIQNFSVPALSLVVSGGHTELVLIRRYGNYRIIGETLDDAAGEAFDKVAKMMGLGFPGGPVISKLAADGNAEAFAFSRPMMRNRYFNFSFSGLKTSVLYTLRDLKKIDGKTRRDISASFEQAVADVLVAKTIRAAKQYGVKTVMIGGGVAANRKLREQLRVKLKKELPKIRLLLPVIQATGDNALMITLAGYFNRKKKTAWGSLRADANLRLDQAPSGSPTRA